MEKNRTNQQNRALHKYFSQVSNALVEHGRTVGDLLSVFQEDDVSPTGDNVKAIWKSILKRKHLKGSTTEMTTQDLNDVFEEFNKGMSLLIDENIEFPSQETIELIKYYNNQIQ